jgi:hypothetical protein
LVNTDDILERSGGSLKPFAQPVHVRHVFEKIVLPEAICRQLIHKQEKERQDLKYAPGIGIVDEYLYQVLSLI